MDVILDCYFEEIFKEIDRSALKLRYKRKELLDYLNTLIEGCTSADENSSHQSVCKQTIKAILRFHNNQKLKNGNICQLGKFHNILYIAMKLCYDWNLSDTGLVATLLDEIYACEKTFERLILGAAYGKNAPFFVVGWRSDFADRKENLLAVIYFLTHATTANLEYDHFGTNLRFVDVPLDSFSGHTTALNMAAFAQVPDLLLILLRFGAKLNNFAIFNEENKNEYRHQNNKHLRCIDFLIDNVLKCKEMEIKGENVSQFETSLSCLKIILRSLPNITLPYENSILNEIQFPNSIQYIFTEKDKFESLKKFFSDNAEIIQNEVEYRNSAFEKYKIIIDNNILPRSRCGLEPPELKHLSRCQIREMLWHSYQLPSGIFSLPIPEKLQSYLDLQSD